MLAALAVAGLVAVTQARRADRAADPSAGARDGRATGAAEFAVEPARPAPPQAPAPEGASDPAATPAPRSVPPRGIGDDLRADLRAERTPAAAPAPPGSAIESDRQEVGDRSDAITAVREHHRRQEEAHRRRLILGTASHGADSIVVARAWHDLGTALALQGRLAEAEAAFATALGLFERRFGAEHPSVANTLRDLGRVRHLQDRPDEALALLGRALAIVERLGAEHVMAQGRAALRAQHARFAWLLERTPAALQRMRAAAAEVLALDGQEADRRRADALTMLGMTLVEAQRACEAVAVLRDALVRREASTPPVFGPALETRCALRDAERACDGDAPREDLVECARDLRRWGIADPELVRRFESRAAGGS